MTREEAIARIKNFKEQCPEDWEAAIEAFNMAIEALEIIKMLGESIDAHILGKKKKPKKGEWIRHTRVEDVYDIKGIKTWGIKHQCNKCSFTTIAIEDFGYYDFCPHCGADMRGET